MGSLNLPRPIVSGSSPLTVDRHRLFTTLQTIEGERFTEAERQRIRGQIHQELESLGWQVQEQPFATGVNGTGINLVAQGPESGLERSEPQSSGPQSSEPQLDSNPDQLPNPDKTSDKIIVAAHYDTVPHSPGADDNGTGIAVLLELARLFAPTP
jgi:acetylornithine deacetylase/succinyl-diaminopimelate desuccinylase-like protein